VNLTLVRHAYLQDCTLGRWYIGGIVLAGLGEPWRPDPDGPGGQRREAALAESCIPDGVYTMRPHISVKYPRERYVWSLANPNVGVYAPGTRPAGQAWGRDAILVHVANDTDDILGCEAVGMEHGMDGSRHAVFQSAKAIQLMRELLKMDAHILTIRPTTGTQEIAA
jgi:hypothetical protein